MQKILWLGISGALGTLCRYGLSGFVQRVFGWPFPWGTFAVNMIGCFFFGLVWSLGEERLMISGEWRMIILGGFMGAFTTFSTFAFETGEFLRNSQWLLGGLNILSQNLLGIAFLIIGLSLGKML